MSGTSSNIRVLSEADVRRLVTPEACCQIVEDAYREYGEVRQVLSDPPSMFPGPRRPDYAKFLVKGASLSRGITGVRLMGMAIDLCYLYESANGSPLALIDETWLRSHRTALTAVVAAKHLARSNSSVVAIAGAGGIADELFPVLADAFELAEVRVFARRFTSAERFVADHQPASAFRFKAVREPAEAVDGADIVITLTSAAAPFVTPEMLAPGAFVCTMGGTEELDYEVVAATDRFVVDDFEYATVHGTIASWINRGLVTRHGLEAQVDADIGEVVAGLKPGRTRDDERIIAIIQGLAICDVALCAYVYDAALAAGVGQEVRL